MGHDLASLPFGYVVLLAYWTVLVAELVGDKSIYTVASLTLRFRAGVVLGGVLLALAGKMLVAVMLGTAIMQLQSRWTDLVSAAAFFLSAALIWFGERDPEPAPSPTGAHWAKAGAVSFASVFFTEWADPGQIAAAALTAKSHLALATWLGAMLAMMTKIGVAMTVGLKVRHRLPQRALRALASASCCLLGALALGAILFR
jgi:putative Ca2+/H+ antiporter (TMEM165/GDT1 family)